MATGRVVLINGTSASGKTSLSLALQQLMLERHGEAWLTVHIDEFIAMSMKGFVGPDKGLWPEHCADGTVVVRFNEMTRPLADAVAYSASACARAGLDVIADTLMFDAALAHVWDEQLKDLWNLRVGLVCQREVLTARAEERERAGGAPAGLSRYYFDIVHEHTSYDVRIDTSEIDTQRAAEQVAALIAERP